MASNETSSNGNTDRRLTRVEERLAALQHDVSEILVKLDGPPYERSLRGRMHVIESDASAAKAVHAAIEEMRASRTQTLSGRQKLAGILIAATALGLQAITVITVIH